MSQRKRTKSITSLVDKPLIENEAFLEQVDEIFRGLKIEQQLIKLRKERGYSQSQFARMLGVSQPLIAKMEAEALTNIELKKLIRIVTALNGTLRVEITPADEAKKKSAQRNSARRSRELKAA
jgi:transcriptional regulator with XRE-family HTH domain